MRHLFAWFIFFVVATPVGAIDRQPTPANRSCVQSIDTGTALPLFAAQDEGQPRGNDTPFGTQYDVTHAVGTQVPPPGCFPPYAPPGPGPLDDIVTFDGVPEQTRRLLNNAIPVINEQFIPLEPEMHQLVIQSQSPPTAPLFPGGLLGPQGQPLTDACFFIGLTAPLNYGGAKHVVSANITFLVNGAPFAGPFDVSGPAFFSSPWDGAFGVRVPGLAGSPVNGVIINIFINLGGGCTTDLDCDDGNPCTQDFCINEECFHASLICDDGDRCTIDSCDPALGCVHKQLKDVLSREEALTASHGPDAPCFDSGGGCPIPELSPTPFDAWHTNDACDGHTKWRIGMDAGSPPIPAGFFGPGSDPFWGEIRFKGLPLGIPGLSGTDTLVRRSADPFTRSSPINGGDVTIEIEIVQLSLVSCQPVTVTYNGGATSIDWNVRVSLSDCPPAPGSLTATKTHCNGGTFTSALPVQPKVTFSRVDNPADVAVLDTGCVAQPYPPDVLGPATPIAWVHDIASNLSAVSDYSSSFHAGFPEGQSTSCGDYDFDNDADDEDFSRFLAGYGRDVSEEPCQLFFLDYDADGTIDYDDYKEWLACYRCSSGDPLAGPPIAAGLLGDFNGDGHVRGNDTQGFVDCFILGNPGSPPCERADINQDGVLNERDVPGFVLLLFELN